MSEIVKGIFIYHAMQCLIPLVIVGILTVVYFVAEYFYKRK